MSNPENGAMSNPENGAMSNPENGAMSNPENGAMSNPENEALPLMIEGLTKRFGDVIAVNNLDLTLRPGELLAVVGPSGCGKSTLLRSIAGLAVPEGGTVTLGRSAVLADGKVLVPPERRSVGLVFQEHALFPHLTVAENVRFGIRDRSEAETSARADEMLALVSLPDHGARYPHELSGGERQRVALARALAPGPSLMLFDEPFASIDHNLRVRLRMDVVAALRATGTPAIFVTHDQAEALAIGDRVAVLRAGRIAQIDTPAKVFHGPADRFIGAFMGDASFLPITNGPDGPTTRLGPISCLNDHQVMAMVRPDDLSYDADPDGNATVLASEYRGMDWLVTVRLDDGSTVLTTASHLESPAAGDRGRVALVAGHTQVPVAASDQDRDRDSDQVEAQTQTQTQAGSGPR